MLKPVRLCGASNPRLQGVSPARSDIEFSVSRINWQSLKNSQSRSLLLIRLELFLSRWPVAFYLLHEGKNPHIHRFSNEHRGGRPLDAAKPILDDRLRRPLRTICSLDPVRGVVHSPRPDLARAIGGEKQVSLDQKPLERMLWRGLSADRAAVAKGRCVLRSPALTGVDSFTILTRRMDSRVMVGKVEKSARHLDSQRLVAIQGKKPHTRSPSIVVNICPHIEFQKPRNPRQRREADRMHALHGERHDPQPTSIIEQIHMQACWQTGADPFWINRPMQKKKLAPPLAHHRSRGRILPHREAMQRSRHPCWRVL